MNLTNEGKFMNFYNWDQRVDIISRSIDGGQ